MKNVIFVLLASVTLFSCSSVKRKESLGSENGWLCTSKENAKNTKFKEISVPGQKKSEVCIEMKGDREPYWDFFIRDYERQELPKMPETP